MSDGAKVAFAVIGGFLALVVFGLVMHVTGVYVFGSAQRETADFRGETNAIERIKADGAYRLQVRNEFFSTCASVQTDEQRIKALDKEIASGVSDSRKDQITASITAIESSRASKINQYNADASNEFGPGAFRDLDLPFQLDINNMETKCATN